MVEESIGEQHVTREQSDPTQEKGRLFWWVSLLPIVLCLYVLSVGPAVKLGNSRAFPDWLFKTVYYPLIKADDYSPYAHRFLRWYVRDVWQVPNIY